MRLRGRAYRIENQVRLSSMEMKLKNSRDIRAGNAFRLRMARGHLE